MACLAGNPGLFAAAFTAWVRASWPDRPEFQFLRLKGRRGPKKAAVAVAASILTTVYHLLRDGTCYQDLATRTSARTTSLAAIRPAPLASSQTASAASVTSSKSGAPHDPSRSSF